MQLTGPPLQKSPPDRASNQWAFPFLGTISFFLPLCTLASLYGLVMNSNFPFSGPSLHCMLCFAVIASTYGLVMKFYLTYIGRVGFTVSHMVVLDHQWWFFPTCFPK